MAYRNPILNFAHNNPLAAIIVVPILMNLGGRAIAMGIRTARFNSPLAALMPTQGNDDQLRNLGYTGGSTAPNDMIQAGSHTPNNRYDDKYNSPAFVEDPNFKARTPTPYRNRMQPTAVKDMLVGRAPVDDPEFMTLAGSNHSVFSGLSGVHKLNY